MAAERVSCAKRALTPKTASGPAKPRTPPWRWHGPKSRRPVSQTAELEVDIGSAASMSRRNCFS